MGIFDEFDEEPKSAGESADEKETQIGKPERKTRRVNPNNYNPNNGAGNTEIMPKWFKIALSIFMILVFFAVGMIIGVFAIRNPSDTLKVTSEVKELIDKYYFGEVDWDSVDQSTAQALLQSISRFNGISVTEANGSKGVFGFTHTDNEYGVHYVLKVMPDSSAAFAEGHRVDVDPDMDAVSVKVNSNDTTIYSMRRGDIIYAINTIYGGDNGYKLVDGLSSDYFTAYTSSYDALNIVMKRETEDSADIYYRITVIRGGAKELYSEYINLGSVSGSEYSNIGYISLSEFSKESMSAIFESAQKFREDVGANKLILDLRYNGGGLVDVLANIAPLFIPHGNENLPLMILRNKHGGENTLNTNYSAVDSISTDYLGDGKSDFKLVVLVNGSSASASEGLTGVISYYNSAATIVGTNTYGKGVAQSVYDMTIGGVDYEIAIVTNYYYLPILYNGSTQWANFHGKSVPVDYNFSSDAIYAGLSVKERNYLSRPYYDLTKEIITAKAIEVLQA